MKSLGQKLLELRKRDKLTQVELAAAIGVSRPFVTAIENDREKPGRETFIALANFFNVSLDWLTGDQENEEANPQDQNKNEALLLQAYRNMAPEKADMFLKLMLDASNKT